MLIFTCLVLNVIIFEPVTANSTIYNGEGHEIVKKDIRNSHTLNEDESDQNQNVAEDEVENGEEYDDDYDDDDEEEEEEEGSDAEEDGESREEHDFEKRSLQTGDTFTPYEMMPIAVKLLSKVENPGEGKGIVSSAKSPEYLADKIFAGFFLTFKRIVYLNDIDLPGLDALQALAFQGDDVNLRKAIDSVTEPPMNVMKYGGQLIGVNKYPGRCHYKFLYKRVDSKRSGEKNLKLEKEDPNSTPITKQTLKSITGKNVTNENKDITRRRKKKSQRKRSKAHKKAKNRKLKIKRKRRQKSNRVTRHKKSKLKHKLKREQRKKKHKPKGLELQNRKNNNNIRNQATTTLRPKCKWRYNCRNPGDLDTCRLQTTCLDENNPKAFVDDIYVDHREDEHKESIKNFRKMLGITLLDEDVEKIIEQHILKVKPQHLKNIDRIETLDEYFSNIMKAQKSRTTTPIPNPDSFESDVNSDSVTSPPDKIDGKNVKLDTSDDEEEELRNSKNKGKNKDKLRASQYKEKNNQKMSNNTTQEPDKNNLRLPKNFTTKSR